MTTPTTLDTRSRWVARPSFAALGALSAAHPGRLHATTGLDMSKPLSDGVDRQSNADDRVPIGTITITVEAGASPNYLLRDDARRRHRQGAEYGSSSGEVFNGDCYKKAQAAVASYRDTPTISPRSSDPAKVGVITSTASPVVQCRPRSAPSPPPRASSPD